MDYRLTFEDLDRINAARAERGERCEWTGCRESAAAVIPEDLDGEGPVSFARSMRSGRPTSWRNATSTTSSSKPDKLPAWDAAKTPATYPVRAIGQLDPVRPDPEPAPPSRL